MKTQPHLQRTQRGAVAVMVGLLIVALVGMLGIVIDLANLYVRKTELQNAADAAALAGVKQLDNSATGIDAAVAAAIALAAANASDFAQTSVAITAAHISFGSTPDGPWLDAATAKGSPAGLSFIKVDTSGIAQGTRPTWFMPVVNSALASTTANGEAVAGAPICEGLPMFICQPPGGFTPGTAYYFLNEPSVVGYYDPVPPGAPSLIPPGANEMSDIICAGKTYCIGGATYSSRTQAAFGKMEKAFNTRFGDFKAEFKDSYETCRPDTNVKEYLPVNATWMSTPPPDQLGVHWSAARPPTLPGDPAVNTAIYPPATSGGGTPYTQPPGAFSELPQLAYQPYAQAGRRIITVAFADASVCTAGTPTNPTIHADFQGQGKSIPVNGFGRFLMLVKYDKGLYLEYIEPVPKLKASAPDLKLYR